MNKFFVRILIVSLALTACNIKPDVDIEKYPLGYNEPVKGVWLTNVEVKLCILVKI